MKNSIEKANKGSFLERFAVSCYKPKNKKRLFLFLAFFIPFLLFALIFFTWPVFPFSNKSVLVLDLNAQYVYFLERLRTAFTSGHSFIYSWERALGGEFSGIFAYYLASPLNLILVLFPKANITEAIFFLEALKSGLCGLTMAYFLNKKYPSRFLSILPFSTAYGLSAYIFYFGHNLMWTDNLILLPLVLLGMDNLIKYKKFKLFVISLFLCLFSNFYIGYMVCIFCVIYFFVSYFSEKENNFYRENNHFIKSLLRVLLFGAIAVGLAAVLLLPTWHSLTLGKTTFTTPDYSLHQKFNFFDMLIKLFIGSYDTVRPDGLPMLYCSIFALMMLPVYFISKKIPLREKIANGLCCLALVFSFNLTTLDIFWHGMQRPNWLNYRYSFILIFFILLMAYRAFSTMKKVRIGVICGIAAGLTVFVFTAQKFEFKWFNKEYIVWGTITFLLLYIFVLILLEKHIFKDAVRVFILFSVCLELTLSGSIAIRELHDDVVYSSRESYRKAIDLYYPIIDNIIKEDTGLYRMESIRHRRSNDSMATGLRGITGSTSTLNEATLDYIENLGYVRSMHYSRFKCPIPFADSIISMKYILSEIKLDDCHLTLFDTVEKDFNTVYIYENKDYLPIGFTVSPMTSMFDTEKYSDTPIDYINHLANAMAGRSGDAGLFERLEIVGDSNENLRVSGAVRGGTAFEKQDSAKDGYYIFDVKLPEKESNIYLNALYSSPTEFTVEVNGMPIDRTGENDSYGVIFLGRYSGDEITVKIRLQEEKLYLYSGNNLFYSLNEDNYKKALNSINGETLSVDKWNDTEISGYINVSDNKILYTSIPYDTGWKVYIDGKQVETQKLLDAVLAVDITPGEHSVRFKFIPDELVIGGIISALSLASFAAAWVIQNKIKKARQERYLARYEIDLKK